MADQPFQLGECFAGLTYDDVGGLKYLYSTNTIQYETLLSGVNGMGIHSFVNGAWRPGVDKVTFVAQPTDPVTGAFLLVTNYFADTYISNGIPTQQQLARVISQPDFLFCAGNVNYSESSVQAVLLPNVPLLNRTGTTNWINNAALNGNPGGSGPGIIQPQVKITYNKLGNWLEEDYDQFVGGSETASWGSFDTTTNLPVIYPVPQNGTTPFDIRLLLQIPLAQNVFSQNEFDWPLTNAVGSVFLFQISTNLIDWTTVYPATNNGNIWTFANYYPSSSQQFYRVVPQ